MAENNNFINVGGRLHSIVTGNILAGANEILDDNKGKKQSEVNTDVDNALDNRYTKDETYNKTELNNLITTPDVQYATVIATEQTTVITDILPSVGAANTIYRVGKWDGDQYNTIVYSEYAWDGAEYILLDVKEYGIDDEPTAGSDNLVKSRSAYQINEALIDTINNLFQKLSQNEIFEKQDVEAEILPRKFLDTNGVIQDIASDAYNITSINVSGGEIYTFYATNSPTTNASFACYNNNYVRYKHVGNTSSSYYFIIPFGVNKLYLQNCNYYKKVLFSKNAQITVIDALTSTSAVSALSANQGRVLSELISELNNAITSKADTETVNISRNLYNKEISITGWIAANGDFNNLSGYECSDYIPVEEGKSYYLSKGETSLTYAGYRFMAADKETVVDSGNKASGVFTAPANAAYFQFQVVWKNGGSIKDTAQFEEGTEPTEYTPYQEKKVLLKEQLPPTVALQESLDAEQQRAEEVESGLRNDIDVLEEMIDVPVNTLVLDLEEGAYSYIISPFNDIYDIKLEIRVRRGLSVPVRNNYNNCFNFEKVYLVNKSTKEETLVHDCGDDITPTDFGGQYIGANHAGYGRITVTCNNHGKTAQDIGSIWENTQNKRFTIIGILGSSMLYLLGDNTSTYPTFTFETCNSTDTFTHVSGATNTDSFSITERTISQWWSAFKPSTFNITADGKAITESGTYKFSKLIFSEVYDVLNPASALDIVKANVGQFTDDYVYPGMLDGVDKYSRHTLCYTFTSAAQCIVSTDFMAYQNIGDGYFGFIQQGELSGNNSIYMPKVKSLNGGNLNIDLRTIANVTDSFKAKGTSATDYEDTTLIPDRWLNISDNIGLHIGYLFDYGVGGTNRKDAINSANAIYFSNALKRYPRGITGDISADSHYSAVCFRNYISRDKINTAGVIQINTFEYNNKLYIYADFNAAGYYDIDIPAKYSGKKVNIYDKRDNVELLNEIAANKIQVKVTTDTIMYGYFVAIIS